MMNRFLCGAVLAVNLFHLTGGATANPVEVPAGIDRAPYERLLRKYVNDRGLVNYRAWKENAAGKLDAQLDDAMRRWLAREDLNRFLPAEKRMELSKIVSWYGQDFDDLPAIVARRAPVQCPDCRISYQAYNWSLNEP